ncbi:NifU family protein [Buchnera aphidicola]|uniref:Fe/S biogenesis protein NfuA n=1 Tax=Buchnera aphidicola (Sarucallis kahawaluokalani) TaxID=1241878 RepID=A0A4D6YKE4_9GAMM|nr:NifU family protein [Buchnera aphidicola]QCI26148.1 Fe-S biogenesis protein NfuA [Buchnera aphidicola (Sarucallis kahawaluokalani)]
MIHITKKAQKYLKNLLLQQNKYKSLRISITSPGTKFAQCKISYDTCHRVKNEDIELKYNGFNVYIEKLFLPYLRDAQIDLLGDLINQKLMLLAPHAIKNINSADHNKNTIQKDSIFSKVQNFIAYNINPMLNMHGGKIILMEVTQQGYVMIRFLGGCNGCSMSKVTLKKGIEEKILKNFPNLKGVQDITQHHRGSHSFV